ncbi:MAG: DUF2156 domain-containing protein [Candidatus Omnitrophica bacterium]|nr:DUF2156 domain-containing protein [Candidatus Omnitrophota bacterium]
MKYHRLSLAGIAEFTQILERARGSLSVYAFASLYMWRGLYQVSWAQIQGVRCVFFKDRIGSFLNLAPLGKVTPQLLKRIFTAMDEVNTNPGISRIENVEEKDIAGYRALGYRATLKSHDYLYSRTALVALRGNSFKSKRSCINYFTRHYSFKVCRYVPGYRTGCMEVYDAWQGQRKKITDDPVYQGMLEDSQSALEVVLRNFRPLRCQGIVVKVGSKIKAFTLGYPLGRNTFCIAYEVADLSVKGLSQFIFQQFCRQLEGYTYINAMDDCGLENIKAVKRSYRPLARIPAYVITR